MAASVGKSGIRAMVALPLVSRGEVIGALRMAFAEERAWDGEERAFFTAISEQCAQALDRAQLYEDAIGARELAERATRARDEFLSIVVHDLANPLHGIALRAAHLLGVAPAGAAGATMRTSASKIQESVKWMASLLHDLRDTASIDSGRLSMSRKDEDAAAILVETRDAFAPLCGEKGLSIVSRAKPALHLSCDRVRVKQALGNLVANAIKFTPAGGRVTLEAARAGPDVRFTVSDTGPGIPGDVRAHVFERYWRGKDRDATKGLGLGLFIAKAIVEAHGGAIKVDSGADGATGSTFSFTIPRVLAKAKRGT
jgi:signal transduction histidine kinase